MWADCPPPTPKGYYELMRKQLVDGYTDSVTEFGRRFYINSTRFSKELDDYIDQLSTGRYMSEIHGDAFAMYAGTQDFVGRCFALKYWSNNTVSSITEFDTIFR